MSHTAFICFNYYLKIPPDCITSTDQELSYGALAVQPLDLQLNTEKINLAYHFFWKGDMVGCI